MTRTTRTRLAALAALAALTLAACSSEPATDTAADPATPGDDATVQAADGGPTAYPLTLESPFGESVLEARPERVAVVSAVDLDVALALGVLPVVSPVSPDWYDEYTQDAITALGADEVPAYSTDDGIDFEALAEADPDVILATSGWSLDTDYDTLAAIAPVVSYTGADGLATLSWADRTRLAGRALDRAAEADEVVAGVEAAYAEARTAHPELEGATATYAIIHPGQVTYASYEGATPTVLLANLGLTLPEAAAGFDSGDETVSLENLDQLDADFLIMGYPFGDEGVITQDDLEDHPLFRTLDAVQAGRYVVVSDTVPSAMAYPTPLSEPWVVDQLAPLLAAAAGDEG